MQNGSGTKAEAMLAYMQVNVIPRFGMLAEPYLEVMGKMVSHAETRTEMDEKLKSVNAKLLVATTCVEWPFCTSNYLHGLSDLHPCCNSCSHANQR